MNFPPINLWSLPKQLRDYIEYEKNIHEKNIHINSKKNYKENVVYKTLNEIFYKRK